MSAILANGYVPKSMLKHIMFPITKNKNKRIRDKDKYRPTRLKKYGIVVCRIISNLRISIWVRTKTCLCVCTERTYKILGVRSLANASRARQFNP